MRTCYIFRSEAKPELYGFTDSSAGEKLPAESGHWTFVQQISPGEPWTFNVRRAIVLAGILENGFLVWEESKEAAPFHPVIESDRVEGTAVFNQQGRQIGTIKRLLIEKVSGRVLYVDVTFGGFLGIGVHHRTIPWDKLSYDKALEGYRTEITEEQVRDAPEFYGSEGDDLVWPDRKREKELRDYWHDDPRGPI
jgi:PRC-barrel domain protein